MGERHHATIANVWGFSCSFQPSSDREPENNQPTPERLRGSKACLECRNQKTRCSGTAPQCANCVRRGKQCIYPELKRPFRHATPQAQFVKDDHTRTPGTHLTTTQEDSGIASATLPSLDTALVKNVGTGSVIPSPGSPPTEQRLELIGTFFERLYLLPSYSFLHPGITKEKFVEGTLEECLLFALCAITALYLEPTLPLKEARAKQQWAETVEHLIWQELDHPSIPRLQALLLCIDYRMDTQAFERAFTLAGIAARAATAMRLNHERTDVDFVSAEVRRRLVWSLKLMESYFSIGLPEFELCPFETVYLELPCKEEEFDGVLHRPPNAKMLPVRDFRKRGAFHFCVKLAMIRRDVMKLTRSLALYDQPFPPLGKLMQSLVRELAHIGSQMPGGIDLASEDLSRIIGTPWLPRHVMMHLSLHQCYTHLFRLLMPQYPDAAPPIALQCLDTGFVASAESVCLKHAKPIVQILLDLNQRCTTAHRLEFDSTICGYHATRLFFFISRSGNSKDRPSPEFAISRAELCLAAIRRFYRPSVLVKPILDAMGRMITTFSPHGDSPSDLSPPELETDRRDPALRLSGPARARQGLETHSLLRRSGFFR